MKINKIFTVLFFLFSILNINKSLSQTQEWVGYSNGMFILLLGIEGSFLWIGTVGGGIVKLDMATGNFVNYDRRNSGLPDNRVNAIAIDGQMNK